MAFDSPDLNLGALLERVRTSDVQLPDFQREWKWDDDRIRSLLASVARGHPIGVLMTLEVGGDASSFAPKPLAGVARTGAIPEELLLDGQQRLTSLFQSLASSSAVDTVDARGKRLKRWYYVDINVALQDGADLEDAILSIPEDRLVRDQFGKNVLRDYTTTEAECALEAFPLSVIFDYSRFTDWQMHYLTADSGSSAARLERWKRFNDIALKNIIGYTVPAIVLKKDTSKEAVCTVFEKVNTGGVPLNVFELMTASFAAEGFRLKDDWAIRRSRLVNKRPVLAGIESTDFLQIVSLLATHDRRMKFERAPGAGQPPGIGCKRRDILRLTLQEYESWSEPATLGLEWAATFMNREFIFAAKDVPYKTQFVPLAALHSILRPEIDHYGVHALIRRWFWSGVLGELYGGSTETRFARDVEQVPAWVQGGAEPGSVAEAVFREQRLLSLHTRNSAAYKGIYALLMRNASRDWMKNQPMSLATFFNYQVDIHHIFPKAWCAKNGVDHARRESIVNKTAIGRETNQRIGGRSPTAYLKVIERDAGLTTVQLDEVLTSHEIDARALRDADFDEFFRKRTSALLALIEGAMAKAPILEATPDEGPEAFDDDSMAEEMQDVDVYDADRAA